MSLVTLKQRILPFRGMVCTDNGKGRALPLVDVHRWIRLNCVIFKVHKLDILYNDTLPPDFHDMVAYCRGWYRYAYIWCAICLRSIVPRK